jgi:pimeloyl-ACP methyl ester carboxylesterase
LISQGQETSSRGWIGLELPDTVNGYAVFRQSVAGRADQEAVVTLAPAGATSASFPFDNRSMVTALALVNPTASPVMVNIAARSAGGQSIGSTLVPLGPKAKTAIALSTLPGLAQSAGVQGTVDFATSAPGAVSALGLRFRGEAFTSIPAYHGPISTTTAQASIPAPVLQAIPTSSTTAQLSWTTTVASPTGFRLEWRSGGAAYQEIAQTQGHVRSTPLQGLAPNALHSFRVRVQTAAGLSGYSNEAQVATPAAVTIAAPSNLRVVAHNQVEATLGWTNNAPGATAVRVEMKAPGSSTFTDIGAASSLTGMRVTGRMQAQQQYTFRVRAHTPDGFSAYSNEVLLTTPPKITVFLLHGIRQDSTSMRNLQQSLEPVLTGGRFQLSIDFSFDECSRFGCTQTCSLSQGGRKLGQVVRTNSTGDIVFLGYSMGGLIARDLIAQNWENSLSGRRVSALLTLGSPHLGYPYASFLDQFAVCDPIAREMAGDFRSIPGFIDLSPYLLSLHSRWSTTGFPGVGSQWLAAAGRACNDPVRSLTTPAGCSDGSPRNDTVVCSDSATYSVVTSPATKPTTLWTDPEQRYIHADPFVLGLSRLFCDHSGDGTFELPLNNPPPRGLLIARLAEVLNALP